ncbi:MAG: ATP-binding protein [Snowella sp.]|nr:ATP-binding protein [Snowella sp.]
MIKKKKKHSTALSNQEVEKLIDLPTQNRLEIGDLCNDEKDDPNQVHLTHFIQPHGVFFVLEEPNFTILQISDNTEAIFGIAASSLLGKPLSTLFAQTEIENLSQNLQDQAIETFSAFTFTSIVKNDGQEFRGFVHRNQQTLILEIEILESQATLDNREENDFYSLIKTSLLRIKRASSFQATLDAIAAEVRQITGFDRVMVYRLDLDNTGVVIAESKREDWESYLDLHYPAVDIPENCRKLYYENWLRTIVDVNCQSVPIIPANHPQTKKRTDLSFSILRSVPDCHLEYLRNMDVAATLCISLINEHQLWGLIVCHHGSPNFVSYEKRKYCELLGQVMSLELIKRQEKEAKRYWAEIKNIQTYLQQTLKDLMPLQSTGVSQILKKYSHNILDLVNAQGAVAYFDSELTLLGETPDRQQVQKLLAWFLGFSKQEVFATNSLSKVYPEAIAFKNVASGFLGISIFLNQTSYHLLWFRPEIIQTVNWGRDPHETLPDNPQETPRLSPQGSFETWKEIVKATSLPWQMLEIDAAKELRNTLMLAALEFSQSALLKAARQADVANQAKTQFLAKMSHELRTPLNAILGFSQMMNRDESLSVEHRQHLAIINNSGEHLLALINDVLEMSKIEAGKLSFNESSFDLYQVLNAIEQMLKLKAQTKNLQLILDFSPGIPRYIQTDESKLRQVLINLLENAIKFTHSGTILLRVHPGKEPQHLIFEISDTGVGIAETELATLFDPFVQSESGRLSMQGTGLGLPISQQFVRLMGGDITVTSEVGHGSTFTFDIHVRCDVNSHPLDALAANPNQMPIALAPNQPQYRIVVAEDVNENRLLLSQYLSSLGFEVRLATNGQEAIAVWQEWQPQVILMDVLMPIIDGHEATKRIKALPNGEKTIIIALTANAFSDAQMMALEAGCDDYLAKPFRLEAILDKLGKHLNVQYLYEDSRTSSDQSSDQHSTLTPEMLQIMPSLWIEQLHDAALQMEEEVIQALIAQIPPENETLIQQLNHLLDNFRSDLIVSLTTPAS